MGSKSRNKGKRGEREAAAAISRHLGVPARRGVQYHGGEDSPDLVTGLAGVHFEVKRTETLSLYDAMGQAIDDAGDKVPVVLHRRNNRVWLAACRLEDLPRLCDIVSHARGDIVSHKEEIDGVRQHKHGDIVPKQGEEDTGSADPHGQL